MGKSKTKSQRIGTFAEFSKVKNKRPIKENSQVSITVPFWDDAITFALNNLHEMGDYPIDWGRLVDKIKTKFTILNIFDSQLFTDESFVLAHIKDILYQNYFADGYLSGDTGGADNYGTESMGAKALILSTLADTVLRKVRVEAELDSEPEVEDPKPVATVSLETCYGDDDDLPFEQRHVAGFQAFTKVLKESINKLSLQDDGKALDYCLNKIESAAGSTKLDDILKAAKKEGFQDLRGYILSVVDGYLKTTTIELNGKSLKGRGDEKPVLRVAKKLFAHEITKQIMEIIQKENQKEDEKVK